MHIKVFYLLTRAMGLYEYKYKITTEKDYVQLFF